MMEKRSADCVFLKRIDTYLFEVLEAIDNEGFDCDALEDLIVVDHDRLHCGEAFDLGQQDERVEVVVRKHEFLQLRELLQFV